ncbi:MCU domain-containing protein [Mycena indigotica]|uniref:Calcium uniporter protein, mitochondrial n=1 Tax=Mycena indigotica TaxID=2126181 RepID=A0A8H6S767_9AGAR|nr:MCU domain-containing protein [Mycena indigotica]KAF7293067.1 MCU domain-containing protein [Mycena indigotica]
MSWLALRSTVQLCRRRLPWRLYSTTENTSVSHSQFLATAGPQKKWKERDNEDGLEDGIGKLSPTSSHLFKLILPLGTVKVDAESRSISREPAKEHTLPPTVLLLHPAQPLSHIARLIQASEPFARANPPPSVSFRSGHGSHRHRPIPRNQLLRWSDSTDVGDFIRDAARAAHFSVHITYDDAESNGVILDVQVPTAADRTRFLRRRLAHAEAELAEMEKLKRTCDAEAHRGARRMATAGFGMLVVYWGVVARLTFWDYGWDIMEPITYLSGLSTVICGYLWFLYQGREVSYSSVLDTSISTRRQTLYKAHGLDIERWSELRAEARALRRDIGRIEEDYEPHEEEDEEAEEDDKKEREA